MWHAKVMPVSILQTTRISHVTFGVLQDWSDAGFFEKSSAAHALQDCDLFAPRVRRTDFHICTWNNESKMGEWEIVLHNTTFICTRRTTARRCVFFSVGFQLIETALALLHNFRHCAKCILLAPCEPFVIILSFLFPSNILNIWFLNRHHRAKNSKLDFDNCFIKRELQMGPQCIEEIVIELMLDRDSWLTMTDSRTRDIQKSYQMPLNSYFIKNFKSWSVELNKI